MLTLRPFCVTAIAAASQLVKRNSQKIMMLSHQPGSHVERTADNSRNKIVAEAIISDMKQLSPTVKGLSLHITDKDFTFLPGQWVDFFIPKSDAMTGFSMSSGPSRLKAAASLDLAVKYTDDAPARWVHQECQIGSKVKVRVGGDFFYAPTAESDPHNLLLVAGGVGINPLFAIMCHVADLQMTPGSFRPGAVTLLYSASSQEELIFQDSISELCRKHCNMQAKFYLTKQNRALGGENIAKGGRISQEDIATVFRDHESVCDVTQTLCYVCGPGPMIDDVEGHLRGLGIPPGDILYEKWW